MNTLRHFSHNVFAFLCLALVVSPIPSADAHGQMCEPRQRGAYISASGRCGYDKDVGESDAVIDYCPHCLNGGTVGTVSRNLPPSGWAVYDPIDDIATARRAGLCGDPRGETGHLLGGLFVPLRYQDVPIVNVSKVGGTIDFTVQIDTNHNGYFDFFLCDLDACGTADIHESCFAGGHCYKLNRVQNPTCEDPSTNTDTFCAPVDNAYPGRWYIPCRAQRTVAGGDGGSMRYRLPDGVTCKHCVVQWYWGTANSCNPDGIKQFFSTHFSNIQSMCRRIGGDPIAHNPSLASCGGTTVPEEFWSCGDIQISVDGSSQGSVPIRRLAQHTSSGAPQSVSAIQTGLPTRLTPKPNPPVPFDPSPFPSKDYSLESALSTPSVSTSPSTPSLSPSIKETPIVSPSMSLFTLNPLPSTSHNATTIPTVGEGICVHKGGSCDGTDPCCDFTHVCVHTIRSGGFTCKEAWELWEEVDDRRRLLG